jgi:Fur family peroxide stress response transcriptional regulator
MPHAKLAEFEALCRSQGLPLTAQRRAVLRALAQRDDHPTADQLYEVVRHELPDISRTTVYRVLETLLRVGVIHRVSHPGSAVRFDAHTQRHHHLYCVSCGALTDLVMPELDSLPTPDTGRVGFEIRDYSVHFDGLCASCRAGVEASTSTRQTKDET